MPPRKAKASKDNLVAETPVVFFLKVQEGFDIRDIIHPNAPEKGKSFQGQFSC